MLPTLVQYALRNQENPLWFQVESFCGSKYNPFGFHVEPSVEKQFFKGFSYGYNQITLLGSRLRLFSKSVGPISLQWCTVTYMKSQWSVSGVEPQCPLPSLALLYSTPALYYSNNPDG